MVVLKAGAVVEFRPGNTDGLCSGKEDQWLAAIVCYVFEDSQDKEVQVNLRVFDENGNGYARTMVTVVEPEKEVAGGDVLAEAGYCRPIWITAAQYRARRPGVVEPTEPVLSKAAEKEVPTKAKP